MVRNSARAVSMNTPQETPNVQKKEPTDSKDLVAFFSLSFSPTSHPRNFNQCQVDPLLPSSSCPLWLRVVVSDVACVGLI